MDNKRKNHATLNRWASTPQVVKEVAAPRLITLSEVAQECLNLASEILARSNSIKSNLVWWTCDPGNTDAVAPTVISKLLDLKDYLAGIANNLEDIYTQI